MMTWFPTSQRELTKQSLTHQSLTSYFTLPSWPTSRSMRPSHNQWGPFGAEVIPRLIILFWVISPAWVMTVITSWSALVVITNRGVWLARVSHNSCGVLIRRAVHSCSGGWRKTVSCANLMIAILRPVLGRVPSPTSLCLFSLLKRNV